MFSAMTSSTPIDDTNAPGVDALAVDAPVVAPAVAPATTVLAQPRIAQSGADPLVTLRSELAKRKRLGKAPAALDNDSDEDGCLGDEDEVDEDGDDEASGSTGATKKKWHEYELIVAFLSIAAARKSKQTSTKFHRGKFIYDAYLKFANDIDRKKLWPKGLDIAASRETRCKYFKTGKNIGESPTSRKVAEIRREIINDIVPIYTSMTPQSVPPSGI